MSNGIKVTFISVASVAAALLLFSVIYGLVAGVTGWGCGYSTQTEVAPWVNFGMGGGLVMGFIWVVILGLLIWGGVYLYRKSETGKDQRNTALDILKTRYAKGEISSEEYEKMYHDLTS